MAAGIRRTWQKRSNKHGAGRSGSGAKAGSIGPGGHQTRNTAHISRTVCSYRTRTLSCCAIFFCASLTAPQNTSLHFTRTCSGCSEHLWRYRWRRLPGINQVGVASRRVRAAASDAFGVNCARPGIAAALPLYALCRGMRIVGGRRLLCGERAVRLERRRGVVDD